MEPHVADRWASALVQGTEAPTGRQPDRVAKGLARNTTSKSAATSETQLPKSEALLRAYRLHLRCVCEAQAQPLGVETAENAEARDGAWGSCVDAVPLCYGLAELPGQSLVSTVPLVPSAAEATTIGEFATTYYAGPMPAVTACVLPAATAPGTTSEEAVAAQNSRHQAFLDGQLVFLNRGLRNLRNTCYMSAILQLLFSLAPVRRAVLQACRENSDAVSSTDSGRNELQQSELAELFARMAFAVQDSCGGDGVDPAAFAAFLELDPSVQQDSQEFFALVLDWLQRRGGTSLAATLHTLLDSVVLFDRVCTRCGRSAKKADHYAYFSLPLVVGSSDPPVGDGDHRDGADTDLERSLRRYFLQPELIDGFSCERCDAAPEDPGAPQGAAARTATSCVRLKVLPPVLVLHLNRFDFNVETMSRQKINREVSFPQHLDLTSLVAQSNASSSPSDAAEISEPAPAKREVGVYHYELRGMVNHIGEDTESGHYTYMSKSAGGVWHVFDDAQVSEVTLQTTARTPGRESAPALAGTSARCYSNDAYMLLYTRVEDAALSVAAPPSPEEFPPRVLDRVREDNSTTLATYRVWRKRRDGPCTAYVKKWVAALDALRDGVVALRRRAIGMSSASPDSPTTLFRMIQRASTAAPSSSPSLGSQKAHAKPAEGPKAPAGTTWVAPVHPGGALEKEEEEEAFYFVPTAWLESFSRCFVPPFLAPGTTPPEVPSTSGGDGIAELLQKSDRSRCTAGAVYADPAAAAAPCQRGVASSVAAAAAAAWVQLRAGREPVAPTTSGGGGVGLWAPQLPNEERQAPIASEGSCSPSLLKVATQLLRCPHGAVMPWSSFKVVPASVFGKCMAMDAGPPERATGSGKDMTRAAYEFLRVRPTAAGPASGGVCERCAVGFAQVVLDYTRMLSADTVASEALRLVEVSREAGGDECGRSGRVEAGHHYVCEEVVQFWTQRGVHDAAALPLGVSGVLVCRGEAAVTCADVPVASGPLGGVRPEELHHLQRRVAETVVCSHGELRPMAAVVLVPAVVLDHLRHWYGLAIRAVERQRAAAAPPVTLSGVLPALALSPCAQCIAVTVELVAQRHRARMQQMEESKSLPTLSAAGVLASALVLDRTRCGGGGGAAPDPATGEALRSAEALLQHPNRAVFKRGIDKLYRKHAQEYLEAKTKELSDVKARTEQRREQRQRALQAAMRGSGGGSGGWNAHIRVQTSARGTQRAAGRGLRDASRVEEQLEALRERHQREADEDEAALQRATEQAAMPPLHRVVHGLLPMQWVVTWKQWLASLTEESPTPLPSATAAAASSSSSSLGLPAIDYAAFFCPHGGSLVQVSDLNPTDALWSGPAYQQVLTPWGAPAMDPGHADPVAAPPRHVHGPPLLIVPAEEFCSVWHKYQADVSDGATALSQYLARAAADQKAEEPPGGALSSALYAWAARGGEVAAEPPAPRIMVFAEENGERRVYPPPCDGCIRSALEAKERERQHFVFGSLRIQLHLRRSKKQFYDGVAVIGGAEGGGTPVHHHTTVRELKSFVCEAALMQHGYLLLYDDLTTPAWEDGKAAAPAEAGRAALARGHARAPAVDASYTILRGKRPIARVGSDARDAAVSLDDCTLLQVGIFDGDTLTVSVTERVVARMDEFAYASAGTAYAAPADGAVVAAPLRVASEEEPVAPEAGNTPAVGPAPTAPSGPATGLPMAAGKPSKASNRRGRQTVSLTAFGSTKLTGQPAVGATGGSHGSHSASPASATVAEVACLVCTYLNGAGSVRCEMCESPLPLA